MTEWYVVVEGNRSGQVHLSGWRYARTGDIDLAVCPLCYAVTPVERANGHEDWHASTDYPRPASLTGTHARHRRQQ